MISDCYLILIYTSPITSSPLLEDDASHLVSFIAYSKTENLLISEGVCALLSCDGLLSFIAIVDFNNLHQGIKGTTVNICGKKTL